MKRKLFEIMSLLLLVTGCVNNSSISTTINSSSQNESSTSSSSSKVITSSSSLISSSNNEDISIDFVINKLNETINKSYTLNYSYQGVNFNDVYVPNSYYYNDLYKQGTILTALFNNEKYLFDFEIKNSKVNITNQTYNEIGMQGNKELINSNLSSYDYESIRNELTKVEEGIKLENQDIINFFTLIINDTNTFDYIIFNKKENDLTFDFYFQDKLYDGYSYTLKDIGNSKNDIIDSYIKSNKVLTTNGTNALETFNSDNVAIKGDINYVSNTNDSNFESINNIKVKENETTNYKLESISNGVSYKQYFTKENNVYKKIGLDGKNSLNETIIETSEEEIFPVNASFLEDSYLVNDEYIYLGDNSIGVISSLLINSSSIIVDAWIKEIKFKIKDNKISSFTFTTFDTVLNEEYVYFKGDFEVLNNGVVEKLNPLEPSKDDLKIKDLLKTISADNSNYKMEFNFYNSENKDALLVGEKHIVNFINGVYLDANYRINNDGSLTLQFATGYSKHNDKVYSFRYDVIEDKIDNVKETDYTSIQDAILSISSEVLYIQDNMIKVNSLVNDVDDNVTMLEQHMLIDPSTIKFYFNEDKIDKITYKYGNSYTSSYVETLFSHNEGSIDESILNKLNEAYPRDSEIKELYLKDSDNEYVLSIYEELYNNGYNKFADYIPFVPGIENTIEIIWVSDYPEGYQYLINDAPKNYLDRFKEALVNIYGYTKVSNNKFRNSKVKLELEIKEDYGYQQFYFNML